MIELYIPVLIFLIVALGIGGVLLFLGLLLGPRRPDAAKDSPY